jgi:hypothetical protein
VVETAAMEVRRPGHRDERTNIYVTTTSDPNDAQKDKDKYGIFAYSRSGAAGNGGSGYGALGGGTGGHSSDGGDVNVTNNATVITTGAGGSASSLQA